MNILKQACFILILLVNLAATKSTRHLTSKSKAAYGRRSSINICNNNLDRLKLWIAIDSEKSQRKTRTSRHQPRRAVNNRRRMKWNKRISKICCFSTCTKVDELEIRAIMDDDHDFRRYTIKHLRRSTRRSRKGWKFKLWCFSLKQASDWRLLVSTYVYFGLCFQNQIINDPKTRRQIILTFINRFSMLVMLSITFFVFFFL